VDVPKNVGMSLAKQVDVLCNGDVPKDIEKNIATLCTMSKKTKNATLASYFFVNSG